MLPGPFYCNRTATGLGENTFHGSSRGVSQSREHVTVGIQGDRDGGMTEKLLDDLGVYSRREERRGAGMTEIVEPDIG